MVWYSLNNGLVFFEQLSGILNNVLVLFKTVAFYSLNNGLVAFEQWFGIPRTTVWYSLNHGLEVV